MSPWKVILATMVIFGCGVMTGFFLLRSDRLPRFAPAGPPSHAAPSNPQKPPQFGIFQRPEFMRRMERQLDLTSEQRERIAAIIKESQARNQLLWDQISPQMHEELKRVRGEIREILTPEQRQKFTDLLKARPRRGETNAPAQRAAAPTNVF